MYDVIVVGARCAGASTALLLARRGLDVLLVDRATFPSDTISGHAIHAAGQAYLQRWGVRDAILATGCPEAPRMHLDVGPICLSGTPPPVDGISSMIVPRRTVLDALLVEEAAAAGAEVRQGFSVADVITEAGIVVGVRGRSPGGSLVSERARLVIGADGPHSSVASLVEAASYDDRGVLTGNIYSYWSGLDVVDIELYVRERRFFVAAPTHDGLTVVNAAVPAAEVPALRGDPAAAMRDTVAMVPEFADRMAAAERVERFRFVTGLPNRFRQAHGPGWALVGDARYVKDPATAQGMTDAFADADRLAVAVERGWASGRSLATELARYQAERDHEVAAMYDMTCDLARLEPPTPEQQALFAALSTNQAQTDRFHGLMAGTVRIEDFFAPTSVGAILAEAA